MRINFPHKIYLLRLIFFQNPPRAFAESFLCIRSTSPPVESLVSVPVEKKKVGEVSDRSIYKIKDNTSTCVLLFTSFLVYISETFVEQPFLFSNNFNDLVSEF